MFRRKLTTSTGSNGRPATSPERAAPRDAGASPSARRLGARSPAPLASLAVGVGELGKCKQCHAPGALGRTSDIEQTLDFSTRTTAFMTLKTGMATGLIGNHMACNGVPFLAATPDKSLVLAVIDQPTRQVIDLSPPSCDVDSITDATVKVGSQPSTAFITAFKTWITNGCGSFGTARSRSIPRG